MPVHAIDPLGFRAWSGRALPMAVEHTHGDVEINLCPTATLRYRVGGRETHVPPGRLGILWAAVPHQLLAEAGEPPEAFWVTVPLERLLAWGLPTPYTRDLLAGRLLVDRTATVGPDVDLLGRWSMELAGSRDGPADRVIDLEVQARLLRMAVRHGWDASSSASGSPIPAADDPVEQIARDVVRRHHEPLEIAAFARAVGWHPNYAMARFKASTGMTIGEYRTRQRVAHAQRLLVTTRRSILDIGLEVGFGSVSRFHAAFRAHTGLTPAAYRRSLATPPPGA